MSLKKTSCPSCAKAFQLKPELAGKKVRCPKCQTPFVVNFQNSAPATSPKTVAAEPTVAAVVAEVVEPIPVEPIAVEPIPVEPIPVEPIPVEPIPVEPIPVEPIPVTSAKPALPAQPVASKQPAAKPATASPYEALANNLMSHGSSAATGQLKDYATINKRLKQQQKGARADVDNDSMRFLFRGVALMIFGLFLLGLAFLGIRFSGVSHVSPIGGLIGAVCGGVGAIMVIVGFHRRIGSALFFGAVPGLFFLGATGLVATLFYQGYWYSPLDNAPGFASFNSPLSPEARNALAQADSYSKKRAEQNRRNNRVATGPSNSKKPTQIPPRVNRSQPQTRPNRPIFEDDPFADLRKPKPANLNPPTAPPVESQSLFSSDSSPPRKPIDSDNPFGRSTSAPARPDNTPSSTASKPDDPLGNSANNAGQPSATTPTPNKSGSTIPFPKFGGPGMASLAQRQSAIRSAMFKKYRGQAMRGFPPQRLTEPAGTTRGVFETYLTMDQPLLGLDAMNNLRKDGLYSVLPVYSARDSSVTIAKTGYAVGGLNVNAMADSVLGFQCVFMKLDGNRLDPQDSYLGAWIGEEPADGRGVLIAGDGKTITGVWFEGGQKVGALGLIRASN